MKVRQKLSSGIIIDQNIEKAVRLVFFDNDNEEYPYSTDGGTVFLVEFRRKVYGLTCNHVFDCKSLPIEDREEYIKNRKKQLCITDKKLKGKILAKIESFFIFSDPIYEAEGTEIEDLCVFSFTEDCQSSFFDYTPYIIEDKTIAVSNLESNLLVIGYLYEGTSFCDKKIQPHICSLELTDCKPFLTDALTREAFGQFDTSVDLKNIVGISGGPVFNISKKVLSGMVIRGELKENSQCTVQYIDIRDIIEALIAISEGRPKTNYRKRVIP